MSKITKEVNVTKLVEPKFLSLVGLPANQTGFKILRDDKGDSKMVPRTRRTRAKRNDALLSVTFDSTVAADDMQKLMKEYGIEGYTMEEKDGVTVATRSDLAALPAGTLAINLGDGVTAHIAQPAQPPAGIAVVRMDFAKDYFETAADAEAWCNARSIDFPETGVENGDLSISVTRSEVADDSETRRLKVDDGVEFVVTRSETMDVPAPYIEVVSETAYGSWGWGQLDFAASFADKQFCEGADNAIYTFRNVVERILFYSELPVAIRKDLVMQASAQFADFVGTLLDALPSRVVITRSSQEKEKLMNQKTEQRADGKSTEPAPAAPAATTAAMISRDDVATMISEAVGGLSKQVADLSAALVQRADGVAAAAAAPTQTGETKPDVNTQALEAIVRSVETIGKAVTATAERVAAIEGSTIARSDGGDGSQTTEKRSDVFAGIFTRTKSAA